MRVNAEQRKKQILLCAKRLFSQKGYYETQISDIISEAGIARGTVYQYFEHKNDIFITLLEMFFKEWETFVAMDQAAIDLTAITPGDYLRFRIRKTLQFFHNDLELCNIVLRAGLGLRNDFDTMIHGFEKRIIAIIVDDLKLGIRYRRIREDLDLELAANVIAGALFRISYHYFVVNRRSKKSADIEAIADEMVAILKPGLFRTPQK